MKTRPHAIHVFCLSLVFGLTVQAFALMAKLTQPDLAFPVGFSETVRTNIMAALRRDDCKFVGGHFINSFTSLRYDGETKALNLFLDGLAKCPGVALAVRFHSEAAPESGDWVVAHNASQPLELTVHLYLKSSRIKLDDLVIPEVKGPPLAETKK